MSCVATLSLARKSVSNNQLTEILLDDSTEACSCTVTLNGLEPLPINMIQLVVLKQFQYALA